jgi:hypothetical protein
MVNLSKKIMGAVIIIYSIGPNRLIKTIKAVP